MHFSDNDVLVIGSGLAGLNAAMHCQMQGLQTLVCSKSRPGTGSCSSISQGIFRTSGDSLTKDEHKQLTLQAGRGLNQEDKLNILVENAAQEVQRLSEFGVALNQGGKGYVINPSKLGTEGLSITKPLTEHAHSIGVKFSSPFYAWRLAILNGRAIGAWGFKPGNNHPVLLPARSVILASGGAGALYAGSDNPQGMTGDGYALALEAGLPLIDMEFVQFYPLCMGKSWTSKLLPPHLGEVGRIVNVHGQDIAEKYQIESRPLAIAARDELCQAMAYEVDSGHAFQDGKLRLQIPRERGPWEKAKETFGMQSIDELKAWTEKYLQEDGRIPILPAAHFCMGGLATREGISTDISCLFAAGEVSGGLHGANRYGGNALTETAVFGRLAAEQAAQKSRELPDPDWSKLKDPDIKLQAPDQEGKSKRCQSLRHEIQTLMWQKAGIIRSEPSLKQAIEELDQLNSKISEYISKNGNGLKTLELKNMYLVAKAIVRAALAREESRGSHYRSDHPRTKDSLAKHSLLYKAGEDFYISWVE